MSLVVKNLCKKYGRFKKDSFSLNNISFAIECGQIYSLIGQNGAGKTTIIKCLLKLLKPSKGTMLYNNEEIEKILMSSNVGYLPENLIFPSNITLKEFLYDLCILKGMKSDVALRQIIELATNFNLDKVLNKNMSRFSKGMKRKVGFIQAIINEPKILILDEPTDGLDPVSRRAVLHYIRDYANRGNIVLITSHILADLSLISDKIALIKDGYLASEINIKEVFENYKPKILLDVIKNGEAKIDVYDLLPMIHIDIDGLTSCIIKEVKASDFDLEGWYLDELLKIGESHVESNKI